MNTMFNRVVCIAAWTTFVLCVGGCSKSADNADTAETENNVDTGTRSVADTSETEDDSASATTTGSDSTSVSDSQTVPDADTGVDTATDSESTADSDSSTDVDSGSGTESESDSPVDTDSAITFSIPIPTTCSVAERSTTSVGCLFYALDMSRNDPSGIFDDFEFAVALSNVNEENVANVTIYQGNPQTEQWDIVYERRIPPMKLELFRLNHNAVQNPTELMKKGAYKIVSTVPIIAYQFSPINGEVSYASDASLLIPVSSLSLTYDVVTVPEWFGSPGSHFSVVATKDGTEIVVEPSVTVAAGGAIPATNQPFTVLLDEGDALQIMAENKNDNMISTRVIANEGHPIVMFSGHKCENMPEGTGACDHLEEQLPGMRFWGETFVGARMPVRGIGPLDETPDATDSVMWQIYAAEDNTMVSISAAPGLKGIPFESQLFNRGESVLFDVTGSADNPGDIFISADKPIAVFHFMTGSGGPNTEELGDPSMVYITPTEQYLSRYVVLVPENWVNDFLVITRRFGEPVLLDEVFIPDEHFSDVAGGDYQVARIPISDGIHSIESVDPESGINVYAVGYDVADSYAYPGGMGIKVINIVVE